jgi:hypothetical protein
MVSLSLLAVVVALVIVLAYAFIGIDAMDRSVDRMEEDNAKLASTLTALSDHLSEDHKVLVCRDTASYQENAALADSTVVFMDALADLAANTPIDARALTDAIRRLRAVQGQRDTLIASCLNGSASQAAELPSQVDG